MMSHSTLAADNSYEIPHILRASSYLLAEPLRSFRYFPMALLIRSIVHLFSRCIISLFVSITSHRRLFTGARLETFCGRRPLRTFFYYSSRWRFLQITTAFCFLSVCPLNGDEANRDGHLTHFLLLFLSLTQWDGSRYSHASNYCSWMVINSSRIHCLKYEE